MQGASPTHTAPLRLRLASNAGKATTLEIVLRRALGRAQPALAQDEEEPIRSELFSVERLEQHAESLASHQPTHRKATPASLSWPACAKTSAFCSTPTAESRRPAGEGRSITPAAEWLLDNYHLVEQQVREVRTDLPTGYYRQLPKLSDGPLAGYPRVFGLAWGFVAHTDSRFDPEMLVRFVRAYQTVQPLSIGELWAVAITLRIVLVENLSRSARHIIELAVGPRGSGPRRRQVARRQRYRCRPDGAGAVRAGNAFPTVSLSSSSSACATRIPR